MGILNGSLENHLRAQMKNRQFNFRVGTSLTVEINNTDREIRHRVCPVDVPIKKYEGDATVCENWAIASV